MVFQLLNIVKVIFSNNMEIRLLPKYVFQKHLNDNLLWVATVLSTVGNVIGGGVGFGVNKAENAGGVVGGGVAFGVG